MMSEGASICEQCGATLAPNTQFCADCGSLAEAAPVPVTSGTITGLPSDKPARKPGNDPQGTEAFKKTLLGTVDMFGLAGSPAASAPEQPPASASDAATAARVQAPAPAPAAHKKTMLGLSGAMPPVVPPESPPPPRPSDDPGRSTSTGLSDPPRGQIGRTMLGMPSAHATKTPGKGTLSPSGKLEAKVPAKTLFGLPMNATAEPSSSSPSSSSSSERAAEPVSKATIITASPQQAPASSAAATATYARTELDLPNASASHTSSDTSSNTGDHAPLVTPLPPRMDEGSSGRDETLRTNNASAQAKTSRPPAPRSLVGPVLLAVAIVALLGLGAYLMLGGKHGPAVEVRIEADQGKERMVFEVAGAVAGAKLRFGGIERPIEGGQAVFPLGAGSLQVGQNAVLFDVLEPSGQAHAGRVVLSLDYRVTVDTAPLHMGKGAIDVVIAALPGSKAWIGGEEVALDAQGRAQHRDVLEASALAGTSVEHVVSYRVQPPGQEPQVGKITTVVPITSLKIDRPGLQILTDKDAIEVAGSVDADATVTLAGEPLAVQGGRFLQNVPLPGPGLHEIELVARATGKAPRAMRVRVERVEDLAAAARGVPIDASLTYAKVAQNPEIYAGQHAAFEGRVYNVSVDDGRSVLQVLVRDCAKGMRCPLWVDYGAATDLTVDSWVRAVGALSGAQKFRAENDSEQTVPRLSALVLVPIKP